MSAAAKIPGEGRGEIGDKGGEGRARREGETGEGGRGGHIPLRLLRNRRVG